VIFGKYDYICLEITPSVFHSQTFFLIVKNWEMKSLTIEFEEKDEPVSTYEPKTVGHLIAVSKTLNSWTEEEIKAIEDAHLELNERTIQIW
jgi:hypothetical protein